MENLDQALSDTQSVPEQTAPPVDPGAELGTEPSAELSPTESCPEITPAPETPEPSPEEKGTDGQAGRPKLRTIPEIQKEYMTICCSAGELQYQIQMHEDNLARLNERLKFINNEASQVQAENAAKEAADKARAAKQSADAIAKAQEKRERKAAQRSAAIKAGMSQSEVDALDSEESASA